jgi:SAM-dependent methyltransferase
VAVGERPTGPGAAAIAAARAGAKVTATDLSPAFVAILRDRLEREGVDGVDVRIMDGLALDAEDDAFDAAVSNFGAFLFPDRIQGFREARRVVKPGGRAGFTSFAPPPPDGWAAFIRGAVTRAFPDLPPVPPVKFLELGDAERFTRELQDAGFGEVVIETVERAATWADTNAAWSALAEGAPMFRPLLVRVGHDGRRKLRAMFDAAAAERFGKDAPLTFTTPVHVAIAKVEGT